MSEEADVGDSRLVFDGEFRAEEGRVELERADFALQPRGDAVEALMHPRVRIHHGELTRYFLEEGRERERKRTGQVTQKEEKIIPSRSAVRLASLQQLQQPRPSSVIL
jgi:hypothetical protein